MIRGLHYAPHNDAHSELFRSCSERHALTMILHSLVLQVGEPQYNLLEEAPCCGLLHEHHEYVMLVYV